MVDINLESQATVAIGANDAAIVRRGTGAGATAELITLGDAATKTVGTGAGQVAAGDHTHTSTAISDFSEAVDDRVAALLVAGSNVTLTYNDGAGTLTIAASGSGGGTTGGSATLDFGAVPGSSLAEIAVTGQTSILSGSRVRAWVQGSTADHNAYEHSRILPGRIGLGIADIVAGTGFTICAETELRLTGQVAVKWEWA